MRETMIHNSLKTLAILGLVISVSSCEVKPEQSLPERSFEMVWNEEFDGEKGAFVDPTKWVYDLGNGVNGWGNNELQTYTSKPENISMDGEGNLVITAIKDDADNYTSARIKTKGLFSKQFGKIEARIKTPTGSGIWPAFWMLGSDIDNVGWPQCGEIDIMEQNGKFSNLTHSTLHGPGYSGGNSITAAYGLQNARFDTDFNVYGVEWSRNQIDFFINGLLFKRMTPEDVTGEWVYNQPFYILLNLAVGGSYVGAPNEYTPFPGTMHIDYIRVYKGT